MTKVKVESGVCGFTTTIVAEPGEKRQVKLNITSDCQAVTALAGELDTLGMRDVLTKGYGQGSVFEAAGRTLAHNACPVVSGIFKAAEVAMGLALPRPARIDFEEE